MGQLIKREDLYELVWSKPITKIAKEYSVSDSAIVKICKKMEIPRPGLGYWTKVECGKKVKVTPLPKLSKRGVGYHYLRRQGYSEGRADSTGQVLPEIAAEASKAQQIIVAETLEDLHPLTAQNIKRFGNARKDEKGYLKPRAAKHFDLVVTESGLDRALRIMDALVKAFGEREWRFELLTEPKVAMAVTVNGEVIHFSLEEVVQGVEHVLTATEKRARARGDWVWPPRYDFVPTGKLKLKIDTFYSYSGRSTWADGKVQRVETCLNKFCAGLVQFAQATKTKRRNDELNRRKRARESRAWEWSRKRQEEELAMRQTLMDEIESWHRAEEIRSFVSASQALLAPDDQLEEAHTRWRQWALAYADNIDPLKGGKPVKETGEHRRSRAR